MVSASWLVLPVQCSDNLIENMLNDEGEIIGTIYNGTSKFYEYEKYQYPTLHIKIFRDGKEIILNSSQLILTVYNYINNEEEYLSEIYPDTTNNYFIYNVENNNPPQTRKFKLKEIDTEGNIKEYELEKSIFRYNGFGELEYINLELTTVDPNAGGGNEEGLIDGILNGVRAIVNFIGNLGDLLIGWLIDFVRMLFIPPDNMMAVITEDLYNRTIAQIPILDFPYQFLISFTEGNAHNWIHENCTIQWQGVELLGIDFLKAGNFNMADFIENHPTIQQVRNYYLIIYKGTLGIVFLGYLQRKFKEIFG